MLYADLSSQICTSRVQILSSKHTAVDRQLNSYQSVPQLSRGLQTSNESCWGEKGGVSEDPDTYKSTSGSVIRKFMQF